MKFKKFIKNNKNWMIPSAVVLLLAVVIVIGGMSGWFTFSITNIKIVNDTTINILENQKSGTCTASVNPTVITSGGEVTGTIRDGVNTLCDVYLHRGDDWVFVVTGTTNANGILIFRENVYDVGTFEFRAICGTCVTNRVTLVVNPVEDEPEPDGVACFDSDGDLEPFASELKNYGFCTDATGTHYDSCIDGFHISELYCGPIASPPEEQHCMGFPEEGSWNCPGYGFDVCSSGTCKDIDSDGDGFSDEEENSAGTNPNDPYSIPGGGPSEFCADYCKNINYAGSKYMYVGGSNDACEVFWQDACPNKHGLPYEASTYSSINKCCCGDCISW